MLNRQFDNLEYGQSDLLLFWLSSRKNQVSGSSTVSKICNRLGESDELNSRRGRQRLVHTIRSGLYRAGHIERSWDGKKWSATAPTLLLTADRSSAWGDLYGARFHDWKYRFSEITGVELEVMRAMRGAQRWRLLGDRAVLEKLAEKHNLMFLQERGQQLLESLPRLEDVVKTIEEEGEPRRGDLQYFDPSDLTWTRAKKIDHEGLYRAVEGANRNWYYLRRGRIYILRRYDEVLAASWHIIAQSTELVLVYDDESESLLVPTCRIGLPVLVDRALRWPAGLSPEYTRLADGMGKRYTSISRARAHETSRILGIRLEHLNERPDWNLT